MGAMEGVELVVRWFLLVSAQSWRLHHPPRRGSRKSRRDSPEPGFAVADRPLPQSLSSTCVLSLVDFVVMQFIPSRRFTLLFLKRSGKSGFEMKSVPKPTRSATTSESRLCCTRYLPSEHRSRAVQASSQLDFTESKARKGNWK